ncbi:MAG: 50S ribosomal protein L18 [Planctomycetaceae bacterium]
MKLQKRLAKRRERRRHHVRNQIRKSGKLRMSVFRSNNHIYAQIIDDEGGRTLVAAGSTEKSLGGVGAHNGNKSAAAAVGKALGERAVAQGIKEVAFDRGAYKYHGRVAALADAAREAGLQF